MYPFRKDNLPSPTLIECFTYRLDDHTTADDASRYRSEAEVEEWKAKEPLIRLRLFMEKKGWWTKEYEDAFMKKVQETVDAEIKKAESFQPPDPADMIRHTYKELTPRQAKELRERGWGN